MNHIGFARSVLITTVLTFAFGLTTAQAGNSFIIGNLRVDIPEVYNAGRYQVVLLANDRPSTGNHTNFAAGWIGLYLAEYDGQPYSGKFSQVGFKTDRQGIRWFVYAEPGVTCTRGTKIDPLTCHGNYGDIVEIGQWHWVKLVKFPWNNYWIAYVCSSSGSCYYVAEIPDGSSRIYWAHADAEEGYTEYFDPHITVNYYFWHPQYWDAQNQTWREWPINGGGSQINYTHAIPSSICPNYYGAIPNLWGDPRAWYAGTSGITCLAELLSNLRYIPLVFKGIP